MGTRDKIRERNKKMAQNSEKVSYRVNTVKNIQGKDLDGRYSSPLKV
jgi:hypothetical protein